MKNFRYQKLKFLVAKGSYKKTILFIKNNLFLHYIIFQYKNIMHV